MQTKNNVEQRVLARINQEIGSEFKNLHRASLLVEDYKTRLEKLRDKVHMNIRMYISQNVVCRRL